MIEKKYLPDEIRTEEELRELFKTGEISKLIKFLKDCRKNLVILEPLQFSLYAKIRANLLKLNIKLTDNDILNKTEKELIDYIKSQLKTKDDIIKPKINEKENINNEINNVKIENNLNENEIKIHEKDEDEQIKDVITADVELLEEERIRFRNALLNEELKIKIKRGNLFTLKMNKKTNVIELILPSWSIEIDDVLLLDLYDKRFSSSNINNNNNINNKNNNQTTENNNKNNEKTTCNIDEKTCNLTVENININEKENNNNSNNKIDNKKIKKRKRKYKNNGDINKQIEEILLDNENTFQNTKLYLMSRYKKIIENVEKYKNFNGGNCRLATQIMIDYYPEYIKQNKISFEDLKNRQFSSNILNKIEEKLKRG